MMERAIKVQKDLYLCFIDYSKAFDKVRHDDLFSMLSKLNIDAKDLRILRNLYWEQTAAIRVDNECSKYSTIQRGVRQGCVMSPDLFNLYSEIILRKTSANTKVFSSEDITSTICDMPTTLSLLQTRKKNSRSS